MNKKRVQRVQRVYREERLTVRRRSGRKRAMGTRRPIKAPLSSDRSLNLRTGREVQPGRSWLAIWQAPRGEISNPLKGMVDATGIEPVTPSV